MKKYFFFFGTFLLMYACSADKKVFSVPEDILPPDSMVQLITDLHLVDAKIAEGGINDSATKAIAPSYYSFVLKKHKLDTAAFNKNFRFYLQHPTYLNEMYGRVLDELSKRQAENQ